MQEVKSNQIILDAINTIEKLTNDFPEHRTVIIDRLSRLHSILVNPPTTADPASIENLDPAKTANELERKRVDSRLKGFSVRESAAWKEICKRFGPNLNQTELLSLAEVIAKQANLKVDREAKRRKEVLIKWYEENLTEVMEYLPYVVLQDSEGRNVCGEECEE
ncbi:hypothetical protein TRFO_37278 [Tritrichomonas foetus]|uniref:Uncharacterized protein n=1 Tax=Tritrichomonas foetus TaxID=1144522 RepID=A0A1J4JBP7_9EUKA|nr:hypothetical protein TRFO_37278 [Tritrichomonas foetus]|eukprot:OHS96568.1 hypothetical protein TRFO_37278 [Tritrichomonas foetus]